MIQRYEKRTPGIAGPFLQGSGWGVGDWKDFAGVFDMPAWFLETLRTSGQELHVPHMLTLEFYAHELLSANGPAIEALLAMGRERLAVMAATERPEKIPELEDTLRAMAASQNARVSRAIEIYLAERRHHCGLEVYDDISE